MKPMRIALYALLAGTAAALSLLQIVRTVPPAEPPPIEKPAPAVEKADYRLATPKPAYGLKP
jgi:hypothetical protein